MAAVHFVNVNVVLISVAFLCYIPGQHESSGDATTC